MKISVGVMMEQVAREAVAALRGTAAGVKMQLLAEGEDATELCWEALTVALARVLTPFGWEVRCHIGYRRIWIARVSSKGGQLHLEMQDTVLALRTAWKPTRRPVEHNTRVEIPLPDGLAAVLDPRHT